MLKRYIQHILSLKPLSLKWSGGIIGIFILLAGVSQAQMTTGYIVKGGPDTGQFSGGVLIGTTSKINYALTEQRILIDEKPGIIESSWKDVTGVNQNTTSLTKIAADGWGNAGAASNSILDTLKNGWVQYTVNNISDILAFGFSVNNIDAHYNSIDYAVMLNAGQLYVYNQGQLVGNYGAVAVNDSIRIARIGNILLFTRNGILFYNREVDIKQPVIADVALYSQGMTFEIKSSFAQPSNNCNLSIDSVGTLMVTDLPITLSASLSGGRWFGNGITDSINGIFNPSVAGAGKSIVSYTKSGVCSDTARIEIKVRLLVDGTIVPTHVDTTGTAMIFDRFGNTYTPEDLKVVTGSCDAGVSTGLRFHLDFHGDGFVTNLHPQQQEMRNLLCKVFTDLSALIQPAQCNGINPIIKIRVVAPANLPANALGAGTSYYTLACPNDNKGIVDGDVWKAINTGVNDPNLYDGEIQVQFNPPNFSWNFDPTCTNCNNQYDAYSVYLHEAIHCLGFTTMIGPNGQSIAPNSQHFSRFDANLFNLGAHFINWDGCYNATFGLTPSATTDYQCQNVTFNGVNTSPQPVYAPNLYVNGSSLSHFYRFCTPFPGTNYVMDPALAPGDFHRIPTPEEVNALRDLGYRTTGIYGIPAVTNTLPAGGQIVAGVEDGGSIGCSTPLTVCANATLTVNPLDNDIGVVGGTMECLKITCGNGSFTTNGNSFTFTPNGAGITTLTYIPVGPAPNFQRGNITSIRIVVSACGATCATPSNCNQICNPDFKIPFACNSGCTYAFNSGCVPGGWSQSHGNPSIHEASLGCTAYKTAPELAFLVVGELGNGTPVNEGLIAPVNVLPNTRYTFSYRRQVQLPMPLDNIYVELLNSNQLATINGTSSIPTSSCVIPDLPIIHFEILHETNANTQTMQQVTVCFTTPNDLQTYNWLWIYGKQNSPKSGQGLILDWVQLMEDNFTAGNDQITCGDATVGLTPLCAVKNVTSQWTWGNNQTSTNPQLFFTGSNQLTQNTTFTLTRTFPPNPGGLPTGCSTTSSVTVSANPILPLVVTTGSCGNASVSVSGGTAPYSYQWTDINGVTLTTQAVSGLAAGNYTITVTDAVGCAQSATTTITNAAIALEVESQTICKNDMATLTAIPAIAGGNYMWSTGETTSSISVSPASSTTYIVTYTLGSCSSAPTPVNVIVKPLPTVSINSETICEGQTATLTATGADTYSWNTGATTSIISVNPSTSTSYTVTGTSNGCFSTAIATVTVNPLPVVTATSATICSGQTTTLTASGASGYLWSTGATTSAISVSPASNTTYTVTGTNIAGCSNTTTATVTVNPKPVVTNSASMSICSGTSPNILLTSNEPSTFAWTIGNVTGGITGASIGSGATINQVLTNAANVVGSVEYRVTPTSIAGLCTGVPYSITVLVYPIPVVTNTTAIVCSGIVGGITLQSNIPSAFAWTVGNITGGITGAASGLGAVINLLLTNPSNVSSGTVQYLVTPTSTTGLCVGATQSVIVTVNPKPVVTNAATKTICSGTTSNINLTSSTPSTFTWTIGAINGAITGASSGSGATINQLLTNANNTLGGVQYIVTPTSTAGLCVGAPYSIVVLVNPKPAVTNSATKTICSGTSTNINLTSSIPSTFTWTIGSISTGITGASAGSGATINQQLTNSNSTSGTVQYLVTPTSASGLCLGTTFTITVTVTPLPTANFTFPPFDNVEDLSSVLFTNTSTGATSYTWSFMDGTNSTVASPSHIFPYPGYYQVTLNASNTCGMSSNSQIIYIIPYSGNYKNSPTCLSSYPYSNSNPNVPAGINKTISGAVTWNNTFGTIRVKGTLTIPAGASLTVLSGTIVEFGPQGKVIVERGALLTIDGATLRGTQFPPCNGLNVRMMWQGIEVWGNASSTLPASQGKIIVKNNALIEDAYNGVMLGRTKLEAYNNTFLYNKHESSYGGGIIQASNSTFNRCNVGIRFWEYPYTNAVSNITACNFICKTSGVNSTMLDPYFITTPSQTGNEYLNPAIQVHNPFYNVFYSQNSANTNSGRSNIGIAVYGRKIIPVKDNTFEYSEAGILASDCKINVVKGTGAGNTFTDHKAGINIANSNAAFTGNAFSSCIFKKFEYGMKVSSGINDVIRDNQFNPTGTLNSQSYNLVGIFLNQSRNFNVIDNTFFRLQSGIDCHNSGNTASLIGYQNGGNIFTRCIFPISTAYTNNMLNIHCNNFDNPSGTEYSGMNWNILPGTLPNQGYGHPTNKKAPAGNQFQIKSPLRNQIAANISVPFKYFPHTTNFTIPAKQNPSSTFTIMTGMTAFTSVSDACTPSPVNPGCNPPCYQQMLQVQADAITMLKQEYINVQGAIDQGQTVALLTAIQNNTTPVNSLKNQLISNSPLSDTVITDLINRPSPLPPPVLRDVLKPNSPVSDKVYSHLQVKLATMPPPFAENISQYQTVNPAYRTLTAIEREIAVAENERQLILNEAINYYVNNDSVEQAIVLLEQETNKESKQGLVAEYIDLGDYSSALLKLNSIPATTDEDVDFKKLYTLYINLALQQKTIWDMDEVQIQMVRDIASVCPSSIATVNAQAVLFQIFGESSAPCPVNNLRSMNENNSTQQILLNISAENIEYLGNNIPNPFNNSTQIPYFVPSGSEAILEIHNTKGELIKTYNLTEGGGKLQLSLAEYSNGIYFYTLTIDQGRIIRHKKMVLNK